MATNIAQIIFNNDENFQTKEIIMSSLSEVYSIDNFPLDEDLKENNSFEITFYTKWSESREELEVFATENNISIIGVVYEFSSNYVNSYYFNH
ncbi:MAG: hypothetical protein V3U92_13955 [Cellulophaga sp.]